MNTLLSKNAPQGFDFFLRDIYDELLDDGKYVQSIYRTKLCKINVLVRMDLAAARNDSHYAEATRAMTECVGITDSLLGVLPPVVSPL